MFMNSLPSFFFVEKDQTWLCTSDEVSNISGSYFTWQTLSKRASAYKQSERSKLWSILADIDRNSAAMWNFT